MNAAAAAAVGSCFPTTIASRHLRYDFFVKAIATRTPPFPSLSHFIEQLSVSAVSHGRNLPRIAAAVAQEEAAAVEKEQMIQAEEEEGKEEGEAMENTKLYFGNLPYHCDSAQLAGIIQEYASPEMVEVLYDRDTGRSRGFAFATMSTVEDCEAVISNLDGSQYGGRTLRVNFSNKPKPKTPLYPESEFKLFVGNLSWSVTSEALTQVFQEYGNLVGARVLYDGETGQSRGYGFVCYSTKEEMEAAKEALNEVDLEGRAMRISLALGKKA
ncbi:28 kDa ribonucleoprotein, chloroplastic [Dendrobium catenatum]|uniref:29 kDa ribonucleoprotein B, chloroplastic n=1 Tax=Dendrobium catenatum TaxID=906689 RepID=A0A2I0VRY9_9ASPA|nr:28 kDa ribonucleoprotein, chloroplastic [Dendrobium catenatum]PKU66171.1 29 kDa ribonucleoprotein B, chloroplastic [Dendrobium catenatum]